MRSLRPQTETDFLSLLFLVVFEYAAIFTLALSECRLGGDKKLIVSLPPFASGEPTKGDLCAEPVVSVHVAAHLDWFCNYDSRGIVDRLELRYTCS